MVTCPVIGHDRCPTLTCLESAKSYRCAHAMYIEVLMAFTKGAKAVDGSRNRIEEYLSPSKKYDARSAIRAAWSTAQRSGGVPEGGAEGLKRRCCVADEAASFSAKPPRSVVRSTQLCLQAERVVRSRPLFSVGRTYRLLREQCAQRLQNLRSAKTLYLIKITTISHG